MDLTIQSVNEDNWRDIAALEVKPEQARYVANPAYYLCLCHYDKLWQPLAICVDEHVVGFLMWAIDPEDKSCWLGGIIVDRRHQRRGIARLALQKVIAHLQKTHAVTEFVLSYERDNGACELYRAIGFAETGEVEGDEVVARYGPTDRPAGSH